MFAVLSEVRYVGVGGGAEARCWRLAEGAVSKRRRRIFGDTECQLMMAMACLCPR